MQGRNLSGGFANQFGTCALGDKGSTPCAPGPRHDGVRLCGGLEFQLKDVHGNLVPFHGSNLSFSLVFDIVPEGR